MEAKSDSSVDCEVAVMREDLLAEAKKHFNEPVLIGFDLCRCVGYAEDEMDCYLIVRHPRRGLIWHTFVGGYTYLNVLKGQDACRSVSTGEEWDDFSRLDSLLAFNGAPREERLICKPHAANPDGEEGDAAKTPPESE